jgi:hypothetical protein
MHHLYVKIKLLLEHLAYVIILPPSLAIRAVIQDNLARIRQINMATYSNSIINFRTLTPVNSISTSFHHRSQ